MNNLCQITDDWKFCPQCGVPRPEEKRELWQTITEAENDWNIAQDSEFANLKLAEPYAKHLAKSAIAWMMELVDDAPKCDCGNPNHSYLKSALLKEEGV